MLKHPLLIIGNQNYSSWSFRAWLALKLTGLPFDTKKIYLQKPDTKSQILAHSLSGKVPVLLHNEIRVWDSLAISLYLAEQYPQLLPQDLSDRAKAYSIICEFHSGFQHLRQTCTMDMTARHKPYAPSEALLADINRIQAIWTDCRTEKVENGPFLFGAYSIADVFFAPVVSRFVTYDIPQSEVCQQYIDTIVAHRHYQEWYKDAQTETEVIHWH
jgi:glutathione S-transferase